MTGHPTALGQAWEQSLGFSLATVSADGAPSQGCGQSGSQRAVGWCGHYLQFGAVHGHCVLAQESERALKWGKCDFAGLFSWLGKENFSHIRGQEWDFPLPAPLAIRTETPAQ